MKSSKITKKQVSLEKNESEFYNEILQYLYKKYGIYHIALCICGAITFEREGDINWSVNLENAPYFFPELPETFFKALSKSIAEYSSCDHCVNHWGLDLCACGSGETPKDCDEGFSECGCPSQYVKEVA